MTAIQNVGVPQVPVETKARKNNEKPVQNPPSFRGQAENDQFVKNYEVKATTGKKWGVGLASFFCSGLGQAINGQWGKGIGYFFGGVTLGAVTRLAMQRGKRGLGIATAVAALGVGIASIVDAVKNAKSKVQVVDKEGLTAANK